MAESLLVPDIDLMVKGKAHLSKEVGWGIRSEIG